MAEITMDFVEERATTKTIRFQEVKKDDNQVNIGTLYVQKKTLEKLGNPKAITVTITTKD